MNELLTERGNLINNALDVSERMVSEDLFDFIEESNAIGRKPFSNISLIHLDKQNNIVSFQYETGIKVVIKVESSF